MGRLGLVIIRIFENIARERFKRRNKDRMDVITRWQRFPAGLILCDCPCEHIPLFTDILLHSSSLGKHTTRIFIAKYFSNFLLNMFDCMLSHAHTNIQNSHRMKYIYICTVSQHFPISTKHTCEVWTTPVRHTQMSSQSWLLEEGVKETPA